MKRIVFILIIIALCILSFSYVVMADDYTNAYFDLSQMTISDVNGSVGLLGIGLDYQGNNWLVGGSVATSIYHSDDYAFSYDNWSDQVYF